MPYVIQVNIRAIRTRLGLNLGEFADRVGLRADRIGDLERNRFEQLSRLELARLCRVASPAELFTVREPSVFYGAALSGPLKIYLAVHSVGSGGADEGLYVSAHDDDARSVLAAHARSRGIEVDSVLLRPRPPAEPIAGSIEALFPRGSAFVLGSQLRNDLSEIAVCRMYEVTEFDKRGRSRIPAHFVFGPERTPRESAFGYAAMGPQIEPGIFSQTTGRIVARHTHVAAGEGEDCALIVAYRVPAGRSDDGMARERCFVAVMGMTGLSTVAGARALTDPLLAEEFVPPAYWQPRMRAIRVSYVRSPSPLAPGYDNRVIQKIELVPESEAGGVTRIPSRLNQPEE